MSDLLSKKKRMAMNQRTLEQIRKRRENKPLGMTLKVTDATKALLREYPKAEDPAARVIEKAGISSEAKYKNSSMDITEEQQKAARGYIPPSRAAKKGYTVYLSEEVAQELKETAHARQTTMTKLFEEAIEALLEKERPRTAAVRAALSKVTQG